MLQTRRISTQSERTEHAIDTTSTTSSVEGALRKLGSDSPTLGTADRPTDDVPIVTTTVGGDRAQVDRAVDAGCDGVVIQATSLGNAPESVADAVGDAVAAGVPVVVTSRCHAGGVAAVYGGGGGYTLERNGAVLGGDLSAPRARVKLLVALAANVPVADAFADD